MRVKPKKALGQHFLTDVEVVHRTIESLPLAPFETLLEIGPGMGILTGELWKVHPKLLHVIEIDLESYEYLLNHSEIPGERIHFGDFLEIKLDKMFKGQIAIIGNFPYNISTQIIFKAIDHRKLVTSVTGMFQKEVAERFCAEPGSKIYGITSVLVQAYYRTHYHFTVPPNRFFPPPKVDSGVISMVRYRDEIPRLAHESLVTVVKAAFQQRRKTLRNALKVLDFEFPGEVGQRRAESLSVEEFITLAEMYQNR